MSGCSSIAWPGSTHAATTLTLTPHALQLSPEQSTLVWIQYQRSTLRSEDLGASRKVFMRARKAPGSGWQVFAASALLEWHTVKTETVQDMLLANEPRI